MPVIVMASPKGGVGKSTCAVLLASEFARMGADVTVLDCDPNKSLTRWASHGAPSGVTLKSDVGRSEIVPTIRNADGDGKIVIVDLEGVASQLVSRAISQADLVIVPMQPTALDAEIGSEALALGSRRGRSAWAVNPACCGADQKPAQPSKARVQKELEAQLSGGRDRRDRAIFGFARGILRTLRLWGRSYRDDE